LATVGSPYQYQKAIGLLKQKCGSVSTPKTRQVAFNPAYAVATKRHLPAKIQGREL